MRRSQRPSWAERRGQQDERAARRGGSGKAMEARLVLRKYNYHVRRAHLVRMPATPMHTHTHTHSTAISCSARSPATHSAPSLRHGLTTAFPACTGGNTTGDSARTCRSEQRVMRHERADRVGAQIAWARGSEARRFGGRTGRACVCVRMCGSACGRPSAGRSVRRTVGRRTVGAQDNWFRGVAPTYRHVVCETHVHATCTWTCCIAYILVTCISITAREG